MKNLTDLTPEEKAQILLDAFNYCGVSYKIRLKSVNMLNRKGVWFKITGVRTSDLHYETEAMEYKLGQKIKWHFGGGAFIAFKSEVDPQYA